MADRNVDLAELEMAFAKDPASDAFLALSAAYLEQGRFMEAMVVCKKGIKSQPDNVEGRLLLAKVYAGQGKLPKAIDEVNAVLAQQADVADAHSLLGQLHERSGRFEEAIEAFKKAVELDPTHEEAIAALKAKGIEIEPPKPAAPEPPAAPAAVTPPAAVDGTTQSTPPMPATQGVAQSTPPMPAAEVPQGDAGAVRPAMQSPSPQAQPRPQPRPQPQSVPPQMAAAYGVHPAYLGGYDPLAEHKVRSKKLGFGFTFGLFAILLLCVAGLVAFLKINKAEKEEIAALVKAAQKEDARDTTSSLRRAAEKYEGALKIDDDQAMVAAYLANTYAELVYDRGLKELDDKAKSALAHAEKVAADHPATLAARMLQKVQIGQAKEALSLYEEYAKSLDDGAKPPPVVGVALGRTYHALGRLADLAKLLEDMRKSTTDPGHLAWMGFAYRALGDRVRAREALELAIKTEPDHDPARAYRALLLLEVKDLGNLPFALDDVTHLQDLGKTNLGERQFGYATLARGEIQRLSGREPESQRDFDSARKILGRDADLFLFEGKALFEEGKEKEAVEKLQEAVKIDPYRLRAWELLIRYAAEARKIDVAEQAAADAKKHFPDAVEIPLAEVLVYARKRKLDDAQTMLEGLLKKKDDAEVRAELGRVLMYRGKDAEAIEALRVAAEKSKSKSSLVRAEIFTLLGRALAKSKNHKDAIEAYSQAVGFAPKYSDAYYWLGISLAEEKRTSTAREAFEQVLKLEPKSSRSRAAQSRLDNLK